MNLDKALRIVLELAEENVLRDDQCADLYEFEAKSEQEAACERVAAAIATLEGGAA